VWRKGHEFIYLGDTWLSWVRSCLGSVERRDSSVAREKERKLMGEREREREEARSRG
jgi:hypothetical protein